MMPLAPPTPPWEGPGLAVEEIRTRLQAILQSLQPPRLTVIAQAAQQSLDILAQLDQFLISQPPGSAYYQHSHKRMPPSGGFLSQQEQLRRQGDIDREEDEALALQNDPMRRQGRGEWRGDPQA